MTIQDWGALGELIGGLAIIVSLIYVGLQIKQNTKATQVATSQEFIESHGAVVLPVAFNKEFRDVYWRGLAGLSNLQGSELAAFSAWNIQGFRAWESFYYQWQAGVLDDHLWSGFKIQFCALIGSPGIREMWKMRQHFFSEEFQEFVEQKITDTPSRPLYPLNEGA